MSRSSPASRPEPDRGTGEPEPLVDALGGNVTRRHGDRGHVAVDEAGHHRGPRRHPMLRLVGVAAVVVLMLLLVVLIL